MILKGTVHRYGDHIDTDVIIPARHLNNPDLAFLASHCMEDVDPEFASKVQTGDIIIGGVNFGCGSSREHAPLAIKAAGVSCVIAKSFARIFYRNAINIGLTVLECPEAAEAADSGDRLEVDLENGAIKNTTKNMSHEAPSFPPFMQEIIASGGLTEYIRKGRMTSE